jgi:hypothetical protein
MDDLKFLYCTTVLGQIKRIRIRPTKKTLTYHPIHEFYVIIQTVSEVERLISLPKTHSQRSCALRFWILRIGKSTWQMMSKSRVECNKNLYACVQVCMLTYF